MHVVPPLLPQDSCVYTFFSNFIIQCNSADNEYFVLYLHILHLRLAMYLDISFTLVALCKLLPLFLTLYLSRPYPPKEIKTRYIMYSEARNYLA